MKADKFIISVSDGKEYRGIELDKDTYHINISCPPKDINDPTDVGWFCMMSLRGIVDLIKKDIKSGSWHEINLV